MFCFYALVKQRMSSSPYSTGLGESSKDSFSSIRFYSFQGRRMLHDDTRQ